MKESICNNVSIILVKQIHYITEKRQHRQCIQDIGNALSLPPKTKSMLLSVSCTVHTTETYN